MKIVDSHPLGARWWIKSRRQIQKDRYTNTKSNTKTKTMWNTQIHFGQKKSEVKWVGVEFHLVGVEFHLVGVGFHFFGVEFHFFTVGLHFKKLKKTIGLHRRKCTISQYCFKSYSIYSTPLSAGVGWKGTRFRRRAAGGGNRWWIASDSSWAEWRARAEAIFFNCSTATEWNPPKDSATIGMNFKPSALQSSAAPLILLA